MTPLFDHTIALISRGHPKDITRQKDGLIHFFRQFIHSNQTARSLYQNMQLPLITPTMIQDCLDAIPIKVNESFIIDFFDQWSNHRQPNHSHQMTTSPFGLVVFYLPIWS